MSDLLFGELVARATSGVGRAGRSPYPYQRGVAEFGLPELLSVPTGAGKTMAAVLPWVYRRRFHPDPAVRQATPRRLVFVLPMRVLAEQVIAEVDGWLARLGLGSDLKCHLLLGGEPLDSPWRHDPGADMVIVGTLDMILSRALNRGYGESRFLWPIDFGIFSADCHFVFDEVQLMGPALATSRQLHGLRQAIGEAIPCSSTWMSATVDESELQTIDAPSIATRIGLSTDDLQHPGLSLRLNARKSVTRLIAEDPKRYAATLGEAVALRHAPGTLTLAIVNTVERARQLAADLAKRNIDATVVMLHSRFRPADRRAAAEEALAPVDSGGPGRIVVSTQVVEAGVDISATLLLTEAAAWTSIVQRAGRCNRDGMAEQATMLWVEPPRPEPYDAGDVAASVAALDALEGNEVTPSTLGSMAVAVTEEIHPVLRRRDLVDLFDTMPDIGGNDVDVARFIRASDDLDLAVAWRSMPERGPAAGEPLPGRDERCTVPVAEMRKLLKDGRIEAWRHDHLDGRWVSCSWQDVRPGMVLVLDSRAGCYTPTGGWNAEVREPVEPLAGGAAGDDVALDDDPISGIGGWLDLRTHLTDTRAHASALLGTLDPPGLTTDLRAAVVDAARLHDIGKAHEHFQTALRDCARDGDPHPPPAPDVVLAKSGGTGRLRHTARPHFRHELASALMLLGEGRVALDRIAEPDLVVYLVAAHHGRVRLAVRSLPDEVAKEPLTVMGIRDGESVPAVRIAEGELPPSTLDLAVVALGGGDGQRRWTARALDLRDRSDIGLFRLGFMEAMVRLADWRASASPSVAGRSDHA